MVLPFRKVKYFRDEILKSLVRFITDVFLMFYKTNKFVIVMCVIYF